MLDITGVKLQKLSVTLIGLDFPQNWQGVLSENLNNGRLDLFASNLKYVATIDRCGNSLLDAVQVLGKDLSKSRILADDGIHVQDEMERIGQSLLFRLGIPKLFKLTIPQVIQMIIPFLLC